MYKPKKYIVTRRQILNAVKSALEDDIEKRQIVDILMCNIDDKLDTVLEDDCEEYHEDDLK